MNADLRKPILEVRYDGNEWRCVRYNYYSSSFRTLNNNNLSTLTDDLFQDLFRLRTLRLSDNNFNCDCRLAWLAKWLRRFPRLGQYTRCSQPSNLKGQNVADLHEQEFKCSGRSII